MLECAGLGVEGRSFLGTGKQHSTRRGGETLCLGRAAAPGPRPTSTPPLHPHGWAPLVQGGRVLSQETVSPSLPTAMSDQVTEFRMMRHK